MFTQVEMNAKRSMKDFTSMSTYIAQEKRSVKQQDSPLDFFMLLIMPQSFCFNLPRSAEEVTLYLFVPFKLLVFVTEN